MGKLIERILLISLGIVISMTLITSGVIPFLNNIFIFDKFNETNVYSNVGDFVVDLDEWVQEALELGDVQDKKHVEKYFYIPSVEKINISFGLNNPIKEYMLGYSDLDICIESENFKNDNNEKNQFVLGYDADFIKKSFINLEPKEYYIIITGYPYDNLRNEYLDPPNVYVDIFDGLTVKKEKEDAKKVNDFLKDFIDKLYIFFEGGYDTSGLIYNSTIIILDNIETIYFKGNKTLFSWYLIDRLQILGCQQEFIGTFFLEERFSLLDRNSMNISLYIYDSKLSIIFWKNMEDFYYYKDIKIPDWAAHGCGSRPPPDYDIPYYLLY